MPALREAPVARDNLEDVAHTLLSFGFRGDNYLTVSVETRPERDEPQSGLRGLFKQYEIIYFLGDERDLIRLRTNFRGEDVYLYPTTSTPEEVRILFMDIIEKVNSLAREPQFYNTLLHNCTTGLVTHARKIGRPPTLFDIRLLLNGQSDQMAYENGWIRATRSFAETKAFHHINKYLGGDSKAEEFSRKIRPHLR